MHAFQRRQALIYDFCGATDRTVGEIREHLRKPTETSLVWLRWVPALTSSAPRA